jgi:hypothetical protein
MLMVAEQFFSGDIEKFYSVNNNTKTSPLILMLTINHDQVN